MPIKGLTDQGASFPRIGELRKGAPKPAQGNRPGADLQYFRFTSHSRDALNVFRTAYGDEPDRINVLLPYAGVDENFEAWQEEWGAGSLKHRCDGEFVVLLQRGGQYRQPAPGEMKCPGGCKQVGRLKVIVPELGRLAYVVVLTTSVHDIIELHSNLTAYAALRGSLQGIPFILSRVPREISTPTNDGGRTRRTKWLLHLEAAPEWVQAQLSVMQTEALPGSGATPLALGAGTEVVAPDDDEEGGDVVEPEVIVDAAPKKLERPLSPSQLVDALERKVAGNEYDGPPSDKQRGLVAAALLALTDGSENDRYDLTEFVFGVRSTRELSGAQCEALLDWSGFHKNEGTDKWEVNPYAYQEAQSALVQARLDNGQAPLLFSDEEPAKKGRKYTEV